MLKKLLIIILLLITINVFAQNVNETLLTQLEESTTLISELQQNIIDKDQDIVQYRAQIIELTNRLSESTDLIAELRDRVTQDQIEIDNLEASVKELQNSVNSLIPLVDDDFYYFGLTYGLYNTLTMYNEIKLPFFKLKFISGIGYSIDNNMFNASVGLMRSF